MLADTSISGILCDCLHLQEPASGDAEKIQEEIAELARRALVQAGDIQDAEEKLKKISERASRICAPKKRPEDT
jgi:hypothetical protein